MMGSGAANKRWIRIDLHIHTPASEDYAETGATYLDILHEAERHNLEIIAFTDHNTVAGFEQMRREVDFLEQLLRLGRATDVDRQQLDEYQRLLRAITVLPGFEFTSHYGAHVLAIFPPQTPISLIEATLLQLGVPASRIKEGATSIPDTEHITNAYELIARAGGIVIAAHANGPAGVISESLRMGASGQSRVAATQHHHLDALEFINYYTDHGTFTSPGFYNGRTDHYERRMFCIQGSDAHRVRRAFNGTDASHRHGIGDRYFEAQLEAPTFANLQALFRSDNFDHIRVPKRYQKEWEIDQLRFGIPSERNILRGANAELDVLMADITALANMGGGTLVLGATSGEHGAVEGIAQPDQVSEQVRLAVEEHVEPAPTLSFELMRYEGGDVLRVEIRASQSPPYVTRGGMVFVRRDAETAHANRGEILQLARRAFAEGATSPLDNGQELPLPRSGVEIIEVQRRNGERQYEIRDLRTTPGVVRERAQGLWAYAIDRHEDLREGRVDLEAQIKWVGRLGLWRSYRQGNRTKFDLVHRDANGVIDHVFYGVSDWGLSESWQILVEDTHPVTEVEVPFGDDVKADHDEPLKDVPASVSEAVDAQRGATFGELRYRWQSNSAIGRIFRTADGTPRFDVAVRGEVDAEMQEFKGVSRNQLNDKWRGIIAVNRPRTGIEVVSDAMSEDGIRRITFRDLRSGDVSAPWRVEDLKEGSVREYAARMSRIDIPLDDEQIRWWGNIGYLRPMRSQVDLVYRDEQGIDYIYYAARREELRDEWRLLLEQWNDVPPQRSSGSSATFESSDEHPSRHDRSARSELNGSRSAQIRPSWPHDQYPASGILRDNDADEPDHEVPTMQGNKSGI